MATKNRRVWYLTCLFIRFDRIEEWISIKRIRARTIKKKIYSSCYARPTKESSFSWPRFCLCIKRGSNLFHVRTPFYVHIFVRSKLQSSSVTLTFIMMIVWSPGETEESIVQEKLISQSNGRKNWTIITFNGKPSGWVIVKRFLK